MIPWLITCLRSDTRYFDDHLIKSHFKALKQSVPRNSRKMVRAWLLSEEKGLTSKYITLEELYKTSGVEYYQVIMLFYL